MTTLQTSLLYKGTKSDLCELVVGLFEERLVLAVDAKCYERANDDVTPVSAPCQSLALLQKYMSVNVFIAADKN